MQSGLLSYLAASIDYNVPRFGGAIGLPVTRSSTGTSNINNTKISVLCSSSIGPENFVLSFALRASTINRVFDYGKLVFGDQIDPVPGTVSGSSGGANALPFNNKFYFDSGFGTNLVVGDFNIGVALQHLNFINMMI